MKIKDYIITPENLPRIRKLGYIRFTLIYFVIPTTLVMTIWIPAHKWLTTRGSIYSNILDVLELARNVVLIAPLFGIFLGTVMWWLVVGINPMSNPERPSKELRPMWQSVGLVLAGLGVGISIGISAGIWIYRNKMSPWEDSQIAYAAARYDLISARDIYFNGDYTVARTALLEHVKVLSQIRDQHLAYTGFLEPRLEIAHTYCRLSLLEESNDNSDKAQGYWDQATSLLKSAGWKEVKRERILCTLKAIDGALPQGIGVPESCKDP